MKQLASFVSDVAPKRDLIVCGDFNAGPDSDEIRMLTGRNSAPPSPGWCSTTAGRWPGTAHPATPGPTSNPLAAIGLYPDRRFDYIFSAWPRRHGVGHPIRCSLLGARPPGQDQISDHYGLVAELRYSTMARPSGQTLADEGESELGETVPGGIRDVT